MINASPSRPQSLLFSLLFGGAQLSTFWANLGLALLRIVPGLSLSLGHGLGKLPPSEKFVAGVQELGFPLPVFFSWAAGLSECVGGLLLASGFFTRPAAFFVLCTLSTAFFLRHAADPFQKKELALLYGIIALAVFLIGSGRFGVDALIRCKREDRSSL